MDLIGRGLGVASDPRQTRWLAPLLLLAEVALCGLIILKVPCKCHLAIPRATGPSLNWHKNASDKWPDTEIDWRAYMEQVEQFVSGERNYFKIRGGTGPLVYPAVHVYIYRLLYDLTDHGQNIRLAQYVFGVLYVATLAIVMACYRQAKVCNLHKKQLMPACSCITGPAICISPAHFVQTTTLNLHAPSLQRLLCRLLLFPGSLLVPEAALDDRFRGLLDWSWGQDESSLSTSSNWHCAVPSIGRSKRITKGWSHCPIPGRHCLAISCQGCPRLSLACL